MIGKKYNMNMKTISYPLENGLREYFDERFKIDDSVLREYLFKSGLEYCESCSSHYDPRKGPLFNFLKVILRNYVLQTRKNLVSIRITRKKFSDLITERKGLILYLFGQNKLLSLPTNKKLC